MDQLSDIGCVYGDGWGIFVTVAAVYFGYYLFCGFYKEAAVLSLGDAYLRIRLRRLERKVDRIFLVLKTTVKALEQELGEIKGKIVPSDEEG